MDLSSIQLNTDGITPNSLHFVGVILTSLNREPHSTTNETPRKGRVGAQNKNKTLTRKYRIGFIFVYVIKYLICRIKNIYIKSKNRFKDKFKKI